MMIRSQSMMRILTTVGQSSALTANGQDPWTLPHELAIRVRIWGICRANPRVNTLMMRVSGLRGSERSAILVQCVSFSTSVIALIPASY